MDKRDWKQVLREHFEGARIIERCKGETGGHFDQFCEFIVEPAFEALAEEIETYGVAARFQKLKGKSVRIVLCFPNSKDEQFRYRLGLPQNSIELKLVLVTEGRRNRKLDFIARTEQFRPDLKTEEILKLDKDDIILDLLERYRGFVYESLTTPD